jgi:serine/threonine-protein kinase HipA
VSRRLEVLLHGLPVGHLSEVPDGVVEFRFLDSYRNLVPRPVLGQKFEDDLEKAYRSRRREGLPDFFANLIPEKGRLREILVEAAGAETGDDLALLAFVGQDLPGAVAVRPFEGEREDRDLEDDTAPPVEDGAPESREGLRFSLAGVQLKFSMLREEDGLKLPTRHRAGEWIVKFDSPTFPQLPENEISMLEWARAAGFDVPECHLHDAEEVRGFPHRYATPGTRVLAIRRYDRLPKERVHQEDFAQAVGLPPDKKYDQLTYEAMAHLIRRFVDAEAVDELIRRLALVIALGNNDAHLKNWSLLYPNTIQARWSPLYDQVSTVAWKSPDRALALNLASVKEFGRIDNSTFERFAERAQMDRRRVLDLVGETLAKLSGSWREIAPDLPLPHTHAESLREHWRKVPLLRNSGSLD